MGIKEEMAQDRCAWRNITGGPTRASADAWNTVCVLGSRTLNEYDDDDDDITWFWLPLPIFPVNKTFVIALFCYNTDFTMDLKTSVIMRFQYNCSNIRLTSPHMYSNSVGQSVG